MSGTVSLTVDSDGAISGTTADSRYAVAGTIVGGSSVALDGDVTLVASYPVAGGTVTTTQTGIFEKDASGNLSGSLTESNGLSSGPTFAYTLTRSSN